MKRFIFFCGLITASTSVEAQISVFNCASYPTHLSQSDLDAAQQFNSSTCYILGENSSVHLKNNDNKEITATHEITLKDNVHLGVFNANGGTHLEIKAKSGLDVAVMNYTNLANVLRYKKLEFGVELPDEITTRINSYLFSEGLNNNELNPFMEWDVDVEATFYHAASGTTKKIDGFYTREYFANTQTDDWDSVGTNYPFRVRFAPPLNGQWKAFISIRIKKEQMVSYISNDFWFHVIESGDPGYVTVFDNNRNLKQGDKMIFPVGTNFPADFPCVAWFGACYATVPGDSVRRVDHKTRLDTIYYGHNLHTTSTTEKASNVYAWNTYLKTLSEYFQSGGKYIRTLQMAWSTLIEFEHKGNYYKRLHYAWEQDKIMDSLEKYNVLMIFNMMEQAPHTKYAHNSTTEWDWDYDTYNELGQFITEPWIYEKQRYCYNDKPQGQKKAHESFTNASDLLYHKQRIRYYLARYGYSTKIMEFEILSEPFHVGAQSNVTDTLGNITVPKNNPYENDNTVKEAIKNYHKVISEYMKDSIQTNQLIGINMGHGASIDLLSSGLQSIDVIGVNFYYTNPDGTYKANDLIVKKIWDNRGSKIPILFTEGGVDTDYNECSGFSQNALDMMKMSFSSVGGHFTWVGWRKHMEGQEWPATIRTQNHMNGPDVIGTLSDGSGEWWHDMDAAEKDKNEKYAVENQYYISQNKNSAVGYVKNRTFNLATQQFGNNCYTFTATPLYNIAQATKWDDVKNSDRLRVEHLKKKTEYQVHWYSSYKLQNNGYMKSDCMKTKKKNGKWGFVLEYPKLGKWLIGNSQFPVYWYVIQEGCSNGLAQQPTPERENEFNEILVVDQLENSKITVYPNPFETSFTVNSLTDDQLLIQTLDGKFIGSFSIKQGENRISLPDIPKGVYICKLKQQVFTFKLLKL